MFQMLAEAFNRYNNINLERGDENPKIKDEVDNHEEPVDAAVSRNSILDNDPKAVMMDKMKAVT